MPRALASPESAEYITLTDSVRKTKPLTTEGKISRAIFATAAVLLIAAFLMSVFGRHFITHTPFLDAESIKAVTVSPGMAKYHSVPNYGYTAAYPLHSGDEATFEVHLTPEQFMANASLCFTWRNAIISASFNDEELYAYGSAQSAKYHQIGNILVNVPIPEDAFDNGVIKITVRQTDLGTTAILQDAVIMPSDSVRLYPLIFNSFAFGVYIALLTFSLIGTVFILILYARKEDASTFPWKLFCLLLYILFSALWVLGHLNLLYTIMDATHFVAMVEYPMFFLFPVPLCFLFVDDDRYGSNTMRAGIVLGVITALMLLITTMLHTMLSLHYSTFLIAGQVLIMTVLAVFSVTFYLDRGQTPHEIRFVRYAVWFCLFCCVIEFVQSRMFPHVVPAGVTEQAHLKSTAAPAGLLLLGLSVVAAEALRIIREESESAEQQKLAVIASSDALTGLSNRQACLREFQKIARDDTKDYTVYFFDADGLKRINDTIGHDAGDLLIKSAASCLDETFRSRNGFYGRWGGDEFIACTFPDAKGRKEDPQQVLDAFEKTIDAFNKKNGAGMPFKLSVSGGFVTSTADEPRLIEKAVEAADRQMYENKKRRKAAAAAAAKKAAV